MQGNLQNGLLIGHSTTASLLHSHLNRHKHSIRKKTKIHHLGGVFSVFFGIYFFLKSKKEFLVGRVVKQSLILCPKDQALIA